MPISGQATGVFRDINVTPLTDVFLVLLVIMLLIAPIASKTSLKVDTGWSNDRGSEPTIDIYVDASGRITINQRTIGGDLTSIVSAIEAEQNKAGTQAVAVAVIADPDAQHKYVVTVLDAAAQRKIKLCQC